jgi:hypothetical protein
VIRLYVLEHYRRLAEQAADAKGKESSEASDACSDRCWYQSE